MTYKYITQEQKAKAYDEAKARMSRAFNANRCTIGFMNEIFPELKEPKESEDEKIRKALIEYFQGEEKVYDKLIGSITMKEALAWLEKQGEAPVTINIDKIDKIDKMVRDYANTKERGNERFGKPTNCMIRAYRQGLTDAISTLNVEKKPTADAKQLNPDKVIEWLKPYGCVVDDIVEQFKKDFGL